jgi:hypothetical protein
METERDKEKNSTEINGEVIKDRDRKIETYQDKRREKEKQR